MINHIINDIYIGDWQDAKYHEKEFGTIFTVAFDSPYISKGGFFYRLVDGPSSDNKHWLGRAVHDLEEVRRFGSGKILVHCVSGFSRSTVVVAGYMVRKGFVHTVEDALYHIKKIRPLANPVPELIKLLKELEYENTFSE